ncbi:PoNe immunity protein domain-containing protein [Kordia sp. SMS9]|uniref:PoNe immunity protein domain-containing protein n=1 Tax=Kordia sp. SMS9 TaxID=2282170 RepID=UPI0013B43D9D|nr:PoNe immunity protein domain-containing protein [Kordia sp. SMS9]
MDMLLQEMQEISHLKFNYICLMNDKLNIENLFSLKKDFIRIIEETEEKLRSNLISSDRIKTVKRVQVVKYINVFNFSYCIKSDNTFLKEKLEELLVRLPNYWIQEKVKVHHGRKRIELNQYYLDAYHQMLTIISLCILLDISKEKFSPIVELIDRDNVKDFLYENLIRYHFPNRKVIKEESYSKFLAIPKMNKRIVNILDEDDKTTLIKSIKSYLDKYWYKVHKDFSWYNSHINHPNSFYGYWAFEVAAIVKIKGLDDSSFKDNTYYPDRLV